MSHFFPIIMWLEAAPDHMGFDENTASEFFDKSFADIASLNCNTVRPSNLPLPYVDQLMASTAKYGLKVILDPGWGYNLIQLTPDAILKNWDSLKARIKEEVIDPYAGYENLLGYAVFDEPPPEKAEQWKLTVKMFNQLDPVHTDYTVFNKPDILEDMVNDSALPLANCVYNNYPHQKRVPLNTMGTSLKYGWFNRYKLYYTACKGKPLLPQISTVAVFKNDNPWRWPTPTEFRTTVYTSLAAGAKGIMFFAYMDAPDPGGMLECLVDSKWKPRQPLYNTVKSVAAELKELAPLLKDLQPIDEVKGWEASQRTLRRTYNSPARRKHFILANKNPHPVNGHTDGYIRLPGSTYWLKDIHTNEIFRANSKGDAKISLPPAYVRVLKEGGDLIGYFDTPADGSTNLEGAVPITGWALSYTGNVRVEIKRTSVKGDPGGIIDKNGQVFIGNAIFIEGARPDVAEIFPDYPDNHKAGWGYMLLTNMLPGMGNGRFVLHAIAHDSKGNRRELGHKTIFCDNANAAKPFGTIDTPEQGGTVSGSQYYNWGWVLTPPPNWIPYDGKTIQVFVDGKFIGHPVYGLRRKNESIVKAFPHCLNNQEGRGAVGYIIIDTTKYNNGLHRLAWTVKDSVGTAAGIGSRWFRIQNP